MSTLANRYDFVFFFDVKEGNPNGDPDAGNMPRMDPQTQKGLVSDVSIKRKVRDYVHMRDEEGRRIFILEKEPLNPKIAKACEVHDLPTFAKKGGGWETKEAKKRSQEDIRLLQEWLCAQYYDVRTFGAVMSTGPNAGQVRGPVQLSFSTSVEPIMPLEATITRVADVDKEEGEMGRKHVVPYGLYMGHGFINPAFAAKTGFSDDDLGLLWTAFENMLDLTRSAGRGMMSSRRIIAFKHGCSLGNAQAHKLFDRVSVDRCYRGACHPVGDPRTDNWPPARAFSDYRIDVDRENLPPGISIVEPF